MTKKVKWRMERGMAMSNVNLEKLSKQTDELFSLVEDANRALNMPVSHLREDFEAGFSRIAPKLGVQLQKVIAKGRIEEAIIGGAIIGVCYAGAAAVDVTMNGLAKIKAREKLLASYNELVSKQGMLIAAQQEQLNKILIANKRLNADAEIYRKKYDEISGIIGRIEELRKKVEVIKKA